MNLSLKVLTLSSLSTFVLGGYIILNTAVIAQINSSTAPSPETMQELELYYPEIVTPSETEGLTQEEKDNLQIEEGDIFDQPPGL
jgi:hypothetical protein